MTDSVSRLMLWVGAALLPGLLLQAGFFGERILFVTAIAVAAAVLTEAAALALRRRDWRGVRDGSAALTGALVALALPPGIDAWIAALAAALGIALGKQVYGGLGQNPFNPAMVGYAIALVSFPQALAVWPGIDGTTGATPLSFLDQRGAATLSEAFARMEGFGYVTSRAWEAINAAFLAGGLVLLARKVIRWQIPCAMLGSLALLALLTYDAGSSASHGGPLFHLFTGGTMLAAFFIATDPVSAPTTPRGRLLFGAVVGTLIFVFRAYGANPDGIAFAVLLANLLSPLIDRHVGLAR